jgi:hypothetical protein
VDNVRPNNISIDNNTVLVRLPVITAVDTAPGTDRRSRAYWHAIAATAIIAAMPATVPWGCVEGFVTTLKIRIAVRSPN